MNRSPLILGLALVLFSCQSTPPKETAQQFIKALASADMTTASSLVSEETKTIMDKAKKESAPAASPEDLFDLSKLVETENGNKAEVKNVIIALSLVKEDDGWRVVLNETMLNVIQNRETLLTEVKTKWNELQKAYEGRRKILEDYIAYKKNSGELSPKLRVLNEAVSSLPAENEWTGEKLLAYTQKQHRLNAAIDGAMEPSLTANSDFTLNYFLQISQASDRIKAAEEAYQDKAQQAHSPVYVPLPFVNGNHPKVASN